jgi:hypothetical protein
VKVEAREAREIIASGRARSARKESCWERIESSKRSKGLETNQYLYYCQFHTRKGEEK